MNEILQLNFIVNSSSFVMKTKMFCIEYQCSHGTQKAVVTGSDGINFTLRLLKDAFGILLDCFGVPAVELGDVSEIAQKPCSMAHVEIVVLRRSLWQSHISWTGASGCYALVGAEGDLGVAFTDELFEDANFFEDATFSNVTQRAFTLYRGKVNIFDALQTGLRNSEGNSELRVSCHVAEAVARHFISLFAGNVGNHAHHNGSKSKSKRTFAFSNDEDNDQVVANGDVRRRMFTTATNSILISSWMDILVRFLGRDCFWSPSKSVTFKTTSLKDRAVCQMNGAFHLSYHAVTFTLTMRCDVLHHLYTEGELCAICYV
jgi:hypothetical protein